MGGIYVCVGGLDILKFDKTPLIYNVSYFNLGGLAALFEGAKSTKVLCGDETFHCFLFYVLLHFSLFSIKTCKLLSIYLFIYLFIYLTTILL